MSVTVLPAVLDEGRQAFAKSAWARAYELLARADGHEPLCPADLELLATAAYMLGREDDYVRLLERACQRHSELDARNRAARCAFWIGVHFAMRGQMGPATGWLGRAQRLLEGDEDCVEHGYLLIPVALQHQAE